MCGKYFYASPSSGKKTCSKACEKVERATNGKIGKSAQNLITAQKAAVVSPNSGRFETNAIAKSWVVQSPVGTIYNINNLSLWASEHADMLPGTPKTVFFMGSRQSSKPYKERRKEVVISTKAGHYWIGARKTKQGTAKSPKGFSSGLFGYTLIFIPPPQPLNGHVLHRHCNSPSSSM